MARTTLGKIRYLERKVAYLREKVKEEKQLNISIKYKNELDICERNLEKQKDRYWIESGIANRRKEIENKDDKQIR